MLSTQLSQISNILDNAVVNEQHMYKPAELGVHVAKLITKYAKNHLVIQQARNIVRDCGGDEECESNAIFQWVKSHVTFTKDPDNYERVVTPDIAIRAIKAYGYFAEDCDSITLLLGSLLKAAGMPVKIVMVRTDNNKQYNHMYLKVLILNGNKKAEFISLDATYKNNVYGWEYPSNNKIEIGRRKHNVNK